MPFQCKMRKMIDSCKSSLFGHLPPQPRVPTSWTTLFLILFFLVAHEASLDSWNLTSCRERQHHRRAASKGCLPVTDVGNRPRRGIIFLDVVCAWWLCCGSHGKSICSWSTEMPCLTCWVQNICKAQFECHLFIQSHIYFLSLFSSRPTK